MMATATAMTENTISTAIAVQHVSKRFSTAGRESLHVLDDISLQLPAQAVVAILGASGCGKSTLLNIISGLVRPDAGNILINGVPTGSFQEIGRAHV